MSLKVLLRCKDHEFERLVADIDLESIIDIIAEIQTEMKKEQAKFDEMSLKLSKIKDQASAEFREVSSELVKSQNYLATLMSRNMRCFSIDIKKKLGDWQQINEVKPDEPPLITYNTNNSNNSRNARSSSNSGKPESNGSVVPNSATAKKQKVVKVTRVVTRKVVSSPTTHRAAHEIVQKFSDSNNSGPNTPPTQPKSVKTVASMTLSPRPVTQEVKPKRALRVKVGSDSTNSSGAFSPRESTLPGKVSLAMSQSTTKPYSHTESQVSSSAVLNMNMPETNIDDVSFESTPSADIVSDKFSCTTDESGFTSASSDNESAVPPPDIVYDYHSEEEPEKVQERVFMKQWDPAKLLKEMYSLRLAQEPLYDETDIVNMEGYLEQLPVGKKKTTLLKTWKRVYCKARDGIIYFYDTKTVQTARSYLSLMGGVLEEMSGRMIGIDDKRGHYLMVRCPTEMDFLNWKRSLYTQIHCSPHTNYIRPTLMSTAHQLRVVIIDLGSSSVRAGILTTTPSYPQCFFPCVSATNQSGERVFGIEAYQPNNRTNGLHHPVGTSSMIDCYQINVKVLSDLFKKIFDDLQVNSSEYLVMLSTPHNFSTRLKEEVLNILIGQFDVAGVNMVNQSLLTPYIYNATSGIVVDIGERIEIVAITEGYLVENGLNRQAFGGRRITDTLNSYLTEYRLFTAVEHLIVRLIKEKACFVSQDYGDDLLEYMTDASGCEATVDLSRFDLPEGSHMRQIIVDTCRFKAPEGLLKMELFGIDSPTLPKLIQQAIHKCPMDIRREMWQSIYLSGGTTLMDGFSERLQKELSKIAPRSCTVQVHASPHRLHAAYIGASMLAKLPSFQDSCITREEWTKNGSSVLNKWKGYFQG